MEPCPCAKGHLDGQGKNPCPEERTPLFPFRPACGVGPRICTRIEGLRPHLHVPLSSQTPDESLSIGLVPRPVSAGGVGHAHDPKQFGPCGGSASGRTDHLWRERCGVPELGAIPFGHAIFESDGGRPNPRHVLRPSDGPLPLEQRGPEGGGHQRHGGAQLQQAGRSGADECDGRQPVRSNDGGVLHVHRATRDCARHHHHGPERRADDRPETRKDECFGRVGWEALCDRRPRWNEWGPAQGSQHCRLCVHHCGSQCCCGTQTPRAGMGGPFGHGLVGVGPKGPRIG